MIRMKEQMRNQRGITLVEVLICVIIIAMVVGPMTLNFTTAGKSKSEAQNITDATNNAETLMNDIQNRLNRDMVIAEKAEGNALISPSPSASPTSSPSDIDRYNNYVSKYICHYKDETAPIDVALKDYLGHTLDAYDTDRFAYQVVMWPMSKVYGTVPTSTPKNFFKANETSINDKGILRLKSDNNYKFDSEFYGLLSAEPLTFSASTDTEVKNDFLGKSSDMRKKATLLASATPSVSPSSSPSLGYIKIKLQDPAASPSASPKTTASSETTASPETSPPPEPYIVDANANEKCYGIVIPVSDSTVRTLELDITELIRGAAINNDYTFKIKNTTGNNLTVKVIRSYERQADGTISSDEKKKIDSKFHWVAVDGKSVAGSSSKTTFNFVDNNGPRENYIIAIFVREKVPPIGESGKIIKRMVDVFSYDVTFNERW